MKRGATSPVLQHPSDVELSQPDPSTTTPCVQRLDLAVDWAVRSRVYPLGVSKKRAACGVEITLRFFLRTYLSECFQAEMYY